MVNNNRRIGSVALVVVLIIVVVLIFGGGIWYYEAHRAQSTLPSLGNSSSTVTTSAPSSTVIETNTTTTPTSQVQGCVLLSSNSATSLSQVSDYTSEDMRGGMVCKFIINPQLPIFTFHFMGEPDNSLGNIEITEGTSTNVVQTIQNTTSYDATLSSPENALTIVDANFDGYGDLSILNNCGATGNCSYDFYLYNPATNQFVYNSFLSNLGTPSFNGANK